MKKLFTLLFLLLGLNIFAKDIYLKGIKLKDINNKIVNLENYKGKNIYLKLWASWCPICLAGLEEIDRLTYDKNKNFEVITIVSPGVFGEKNTEKFINWYKGLGYKNIVVLLDEKGEFVKKLKIKGYPANAFISKDLEIKKTIFGHLNSEKIRGEFK